MAELGEGRMSEPPKRNLRSETWAVVVEAVNRGDVEDTLKAIAKWFDVDCSLESHPTVKSCLEGAAEKIREAAMDYYVSTK